MHSNYLLGNNEMYYLVHNISECGVLFLYYFSHLGGFH